MLRAPHTTQLARKLSYLRLLAEDLARPRRLALLHMFVLASGELVAVAGDAIAGAALVCRLGEDASALPPGPPFNPHLAPAEDRALCQVADRLLLSRGALVAGEDPSLVRTVREALERARLPLFSRVDGFRVCLEVGAEALGPGEADPGTRVRKAVLGALRAAPGLAALLSGLRTTLGVCMGSYTGAGREELSWAELVAHLRQHRSPFVTVELFPRHMAVEQYSYRPSAAPDPAQEELEDPLAVQRGGSDEDGGAQPVWGQSFAFAFRPPRISQCPVLSSEVARMCVDGGSKFVLVLLREARAAGGRVRFLTAYDSRAATEFQCGADESRAPALGALLYAPPCEEPCALEPLLRLLGEAADAGHLLLGPAVTPRALVSVYSARGRTEHLLGQCEASVSAVLSSAGSAAPRWLPLCSDAKQALAGAVLVDFSFRRTADLPAARESRDAPRESKLLAAAAAEARTDPTGHAPIADPPTRPGHASALTSTDEARTQAGGEGREERRASRQSAAEKEALRLGALVAALQAEVDGLRSARAAKPQPEEPQPEEPQPEEEPSPEDLSLEGIAARILNAFGARGDPGLSGLSRAVRGAAATGDGLLSAADLRLCLGDLLVPLPLAACEILVRQIGVQRDGRAALRDALAFLEELPRLVRPAAKKPPRSSREPPPASPVTPTVAPSASAPRMRDAPLDSTDASINVDSAAPIALRGVIYAYAGGSLAA